MSDRDILLERLERKLSQKEKEVEELKMMMSFGEHNADEIKREILDEIRNESGFRRMRELEAKIVHLNKTIESLTSDVLYLKEELAKNKIIEKDKARSDSRETYRTRPIRDDIIRADPCPETKVDSPKEDIIICD